MCLVPKPALPNPHLSFANGISSFYFWIINVSFKKCYQLPLTLQATPLLTTSRSHGQIRYVPDESPFLLDQLALNLTLLFGTVLLTCPHEQRRPSGKFPELFYSMIQRINLTFLLGPFLSWDLRLGLDYTLIIFSSYWVCISSSLFDSDLSEKILLRKIQAFCKIFLTICSLFKSMTFQNPSQFTPFSTTLNWM